ncbi:hypothetical protein KTJ87_09855 [Rhodobacteraceae bacterium ASV31]|nr:hypothetical protein [Anianabacter salinae]MBV0912683.1 hypothetical protein [Anianabacter salinae]
MSEDPSTYERQRPRQRSVEKLVLTDALRVPAPERSNILHDQAPEEADFGDAALDDPDAPQGDAEDEALLDALGAGDAKAHDSDADPVEAAFWSRLDTDDDTGSAPQAAEPAADDADDETEALIASLRDDDTDKAADADAHVEAADLQSLAEQSEEDAAESDAVAELYAPQPQDDAPVEAAAPRRALTLEERIAELEAAISRTAGDWEPDGSEVAADDPATESLSDSLAEALADIPSGDGDERGEARFEGNAFDVDRLADSLWGGSGEGAADPQEDAHETAERVGFDVDSWLDDGEAAEEDPQADLPEPASAGADGQDDDTPLSQDTAEQDPGDADDTDEPATAASGPLAARGKDAGPTSYEMAEDLPLDEEALHLLVAEIVREELQGVLGERITRNVKRLVRREVQRALSMRSLD